MGALTARVSSIALFFFTLALSSLKSTASLRLSTLQPLKLSTSWLSLASSTSIVTDLEGGAGVDAGDIDRSCNARGEGAAS